jgi:hypothetical protein
MDEERGALDSVDYVFIEKSIGKKISKAPRHIPRDFSY